MSEKRTVYSVSTGSYSNYSVGPLFEDRADAEAVVARYGDRMPGYYVEEFSLYPSGSQQVVMSRIRHYAQGWMNSDGQIKDGSIYVFSDLVNTDEDPGPPTYYPSDDARLGALIRVQANDHCTALKVLRERVAEVAALIAEGIDPSTVEVGR